MAAVAILVWGAIIGQSLALPGGAPTCGIRPGHGGQDADLTLTVKAVKGSYMVSVDEKHEGLILAADTEGTWATDSQYKTLNRECITHKSNSVKRARVNTFTPSDSSKVPVFHGYVAYSYNSYGKIVDPSS